MPNVHPRYDRRRRENKVSSRIVSLLQARKIVMDAEFQHANKDSDGFGQLLRVWDYLTAEYKKA